MKNVAMAFVMMMVVTLVGCTSEDPVVEQAATVAVNTEEPIEEAFVVEQAATVAVNTEEPIEDGENTIYPEIVPESSRETIILEDIMSAEYAVWLPGELPQTRWKRSRQTETEMVLSANTAIVDGNCIISFGQPNDERTVYLLANLASVNAVRDICSDAELKGAERVIVCDIQTYSTWFRDFTERRIKNA